MGNKGRKGKDMDKSTEEQAVGLPKKSERAAEKSSTRS